MTLGNLENIRLAYCATYSDSSDAYIGAILLTDYKGFPVEFRYTDPIVPTKIQQVLYGKELEKYLKIDVIIDSLVKILASQINILIVGDEAKLEYKNNNVVLVRISSTNVNPLPVSGEILKVKKNEFLLQTSHTSHPIRLQFSPSFVCEGEKFNHVIKTFTEVGKYIDLDEPLERVQHTLELICKEEI